MKIARVVVILLCLAVSAGAASMNRSALGESAITAESLARWSVGFDYDDIKRDVKLDDGGAKLKLKSRIYSGSVGFDIVPWLTVFATAGSSKAKLGNEGDYGNDEFKWSGGLDANLWQFHVEDPEFMAGRLSIRAVAEYGQYQSGNDDKVSWSDISVALPIGYEIFVGEAKDTDLEPYSLMLSIGPFYSYIDGKQENPVSDLDFKASQEFGFMGAVDLFIAHNLSIGFRVDCFDDVSWNGNARYHF